MIRELKTRTAEEISTEKIPEIISSILDGKKIGNIEKKSGVNFLDPNLLEN
jgi:hypothetical protein